jgi:KDO2-lipid IV(A) lauroyltransferase
MPGADRVRPLLPRYWPTWIGMALLRVVVLLPYPLVMAIGRLAGRTIRLWSGERERFADINLQLCFPDMTREQRRAVLRDNFASMGMGLMEVGIGWWWSRERVERLLVEVDGESNLPAPGTPGGTIFLTAHFTSLELSGRFLGHRVPSHAMYRPNENPVIQAMFERQRTRHTLGIISRNDVRGMIRALRAGEGVWFAPDQNFGHKGLVFADFLGVPAATNPATGRFAGLTGARVVPFVLLRVAGGYRLIIEPALDGFPSDGASADAQRINDVFSRWTRLAPAQYNWIHRRFKTRPDGSRSPYKNSRAPAVPR